MVWFQCEDCGENLKKPKLPNHFRSCSATKLSCIDCGETFGQQSVQGHTQCITEAEKYGPKGQGKASNGTPAKPNNSAKKNSDVDINVGLSSRHPWYCSLCNTSATSQQTLLLHAEGKKHRAKARAFHASKQPPKQVDDTIISNTNGDLPKTDPVPDNNNDNGSAPSDTKRKLAGSDNENVKKNKVIQEKKIKWKKLITSVLKSNPEGEMKMKKLQKLVLKSLEESDKIQDKEELKEKLMKKISSSSRFAVDNKLVRLVVA